MTRVPLFCVTEDACTVVHEVLLNARENSSVPGLFAYIAARGSPDNEAGLTTEILPGASVSSDFINAPEEDCQQWSLDEAQKCRSLDRGVLAIADARTAIDGTISFQINLLEMQVEFPRYGLLPQHPYAWHHYRIDTRHAPVAYAALLFTEPDVTYPVYFGRKEEFTDEQGVFDTTRAARAIDKKDKGDE